MDVREVLYISAGKYLGGAELSLAALVAHLNPDRYRARVCLDENGSVILAEMLEDAGAEVQLLDMPTFNRTCNPLRLAGMAISMRRVARAVRRIAWRQSSSLIHANSLTAMLCCALAPTERMAPIVWQHRDREIPRPCSVLCSRASAGIGVSREAVQELRRVLSHKPCELIHSGVDLSLCANVPENRQARRALALPEDAPLLLCASHYALWKRHDMFIKVLKKVQEKLPETVGIIAADPESGSKKCNPETIMQLAEAEGVQDSLVLRGFFPEEMPALYAASDVLVHMAENEPLGRCVIEAIACGLPVVASDSGGPRELVGTHGVLVRPGDVSTASGEVLRLLKGRNLPRESAIRNGYRDMQKYSAKLCALKTMDFYDLLLQGNLSPVAETATGTSVIHQPRPA